MTKKPSSALIDSYTAGRVPEDMLLPPDPQRTRYSPADVGKTSVNFWMPDEMLHELDRWRAARGISTRTGAVKQIVRWALAQPWPGGNAPPIAMSEEQPDPRVQADMQSDTVRQGPRGNRIETAGVSRVVCRTMAQFNRDMASRPGLSPEQQADHLEVADLWDRAEQVASRRPPGAVADDDEEREPADMQSAEDAAE